MSQPPSDLESLQERIAELERANAQLVQFVNILATDLRTPLRHLTGFCRIVKHEYADKLGPRGRTFMDNAVVGAKRIRELVDDLVTIARVRSEDFQIEQFKLAEVFDEVTTALASQIRDSRAKITTSSLPTLAGSAVLIRVLLQNLIDNAIKYAGDSRPEIHIDSTNKAGEWQISVADNGIGIVPERHDVIFDAFKRFESAGGAYQTTGLGLFACKEIVERHGGKIWLESAPNEGSTFHFTIAEPGDD